MEIIVKVVWVFSKEKGLENDDKNTENELVSVASTGKSRAIDLVFEVLVNVNVLEVIEIDVVELVEALFFIFSYQALLLNFMRFDIDVVVSDESISAEKEVSDGGTFFHFVKARSYGLWPF